MIFWSGSAREKEAFIYHVVDSGGYPAREYRFGGALGWGGKFRNNGDVPYVDCYQEHLNDERRAVIAAVNAALGDLFEGE